MADKKRCCCNCGNCLRVPDPSSGVSTNYCAIDMHYIGYLETFEDWCRRWKKDHAFDGEEEK